METENRRCPVDIHPAILLPILTCMERLPRTPTKPRHLILPIDSAHDAHCDLARVIHTKSNSSRTPLLACFGHGRGCSLRSAAKWFASRQRHPVVVVHPYLPPHYLLGT